MTTKSLTSDHRLASYGTLAPGRENHHVMGGMLGQWESGVVRGHLCPKGWGATRGFPGLILDRDGVDVPVMIFSSSDLPDHWERLDAFEGPDYHRVVTDIETKDGVISASIYVVERD